MIFEPERVKGFQDFLPPESLKREKIKSVVGKYFKLYGFLPVETPTIEYDELMRSDNLEKEDEVISDRFRLKDKGMPYMRGSGNGDLYVQINTEVPVSLNREQKELLEKFREIENEKSNPSIKKFFQKAKSFWKK